MIYKNIYFGYWEINHKSFELGLSITQVNYLYSWMVVDVEIDLFLLN